MNRIRVIDGDRTVAEFYAPQGDNGRTLDKVGASTRAHHPHWRVISEPVKRRPTKRDGRPPVLTVLGRPVADVVPRQHR